jgi:hypothetical protein
MRQQPLAICALQAYVPSQNSQSFIRIYPHYRPTQMLHIVYRDPIHARRRCLQTLHRFGPYRNLSPRRAERGPLAAGYRKNLGSCAPKNTHIPLLRLNLQLRSLHSHTPNNSHTAKMAELTHPTIKDGKIFQSNTSQWLAAKWYRRMRDSH